MKYFFSTLEYNSFNVSVRKLLLCTDDKTGAQGGFGLLRIKLDLLRVPAMVGVESQDSQAGLSLQGPHSPFCCSLPKSLFHSSALCGTVSEYEGFLKQSPYFIDLQGNFLQSF